MEKETELYLVKRIKDLEHLNDFLKRTCQLKDIELGCAKGQGDKKIIEEIKYQPIQVDKTIEGEVAFYKGHKIDINTIKKAEAFDTLVDLLGIEVCHWVDEKRYELRFNKQGVKYPILEETFDKLWGGING